MPVNDYSVSGAHQLNKWVWSRLREDLSSEFTVYLDPTKPTNRLVPIIPSQQLPTFTEIAGGAPFMIYNYSNVGTGDVWESQDAVGYVVYDDKEDRLRTIHNYMVRLLSRRDWTAADINTYLDSEARRTGEPNEFDFKWVNLDSAAGPQPFESEGGRHAALIMVTASYVRDFSGDPRLLGDGLGMRT